VSFYREDMSKDHIANAIAYHKRKAAWHAARVKELTAGARNPRSRKPPKEDKIGYAAVWQGGKLVQFHGSLDEFEQDYAVRGRR
jgi:hypothetical protein